MAKAETATINYPEWTDYRKKNGLDPLGMQNSSVSLYQTFLPGISNVTLRMHYYGLYAWLCRTYAQKDRDTNPESWKRFMHYDLGYIDLEQKTLQPLDNPFGSGLSPMS